MKKFAKKHLLTMAGVFIGAIAGYLYWKFIGCTSGTCAITSNPLNSTIYGATEQAPTKGGTNFSATTFEKCSPTEITHSQSNQNNLSSPDLLPVAIFTAAFLFLFGIRYITKGNKHPLYSSSGKIRNAIPLFLEYRKLIIHYSH